MPIDPRHSAIGDPARFINQCIADVNRRISALERASGFTSVATTVIPAGTPGWPPGGFTAQAKGLYAVLKDWQQTPLADPVLAGAIPLTDGVLHWDATNHKLWISSGGTWKQSNTYT